MRHYESVWTKLKNLSRTDAETVGISVTANRVLHPRIIKAVIKEKWMDIGFKLSSDIYHTKLSYTIKHSVITFYLTYHVLKDARITLQDI